MKPTFQVALTPAQFKALVAKYGGGIEPPDVGTLPQTHGVVLSYSVNRASDVSFVVTLTVEKKPWLANVAMIQSQVQHMVAQV